MKRIKFKQIKALRELGFVKPWYFLLYKTGLYSGYYRQLTPKRRYFYEGKPGIGAIDSFPKVNQAEINKTLSAADEICRGEVRLFGGEPVPLDLEIGASNEHWTYLERKPTLEDIKIIWEPARFGWAITLARAYAFSANPVYAQVFWDKTRKFLKAHPPNMGRQWQSAQEVAIRLMALVFCDRVFATAPSTDLENRKALWSALAEHAQRIPPTLVYAKAQNNNHLLAEAAGLYTAGIYLPTHPQAVKWKRLGWRWLNWGFQDQISEFGTYMQHSTNYHRVMLQIALFADHIRRISGDVDWPPETLDRLIAAMRWLWALTDPETGQVPNLGANDGAYLFPLSSLPQEDFRPVLEAAARAFLNTSIYDKSELHEMSNWLNLPQPTAIKQNQPQAHDMMCVPSNEGKAFFRAAQFTDRPSHADQLHVDLWWRGKNVAIDPGTYHYNAPTPWDNTLKSSQVHNTLTVDSREQMTHAGRFLWLDWAQAHILGYEHDDDNQLKWVTAEHDGFRKLGLIHQRQLSRMENGWEVADTVLKKDKQDEKHHSVNLTWLMPDWDWSVESENTILFAGPEFSYKLQISGVDHINLVRAGKTLLGQITAKPFWGWYSPTYAKKLPALLLIANKVGRTPLSLTSTWQFLD